MTIAHGWAAPARGKMLVPHEYPLAPLGPMDVEIAVSQCGVCHSDLHLIDDDWRTSTYPLVPGHEVVGTVRAAGNAVAGLEPGDRVGVGWQSASCQQCEWCLSAMEELCEQSIPTAVGRAGGFADRMVVDSRFAFPIPDALDSAEAAPLLCAGLTVWSPLERYGVRVGSRVAVVSLGGLGHIAVQFARAMGAEVTVISGTADKRDDARELGATGFTSLADRDGLAALASSFQLVLTTASADLPWRALLQTVRPTGTLCLVGAAPNDVQVPSGPLISGHRAVTGSSTGSRAGMTRMLAFAAEHDVRPRIERYSIQEVNHALDLVRNNQVRYRAVLEQPDS